ncbi:LrgB family protein [Robertmurraya sp. FSL R5-0851]|uniref:LrgB family protein n=1 Tax=Robertmurraya sp. FSL R5-0851 TaxID=2921584 RepID=UPI0030F818EE
MQQFLVSIIIVVLTVGMYLLMNRLYLKYSFAFLLPLLTTTIAIIVILSVLQLSYETYMIGGEWINHLLGPAVVALAIPLYKQRKTLMGQLVPIVGGVVMGLVVGMVSGVLLAEVLGVSQNLILSIIPKSITTPVAIQVTTAIGGISSMTIVFVLLAGLTGAVLGPTVFKWFRVTSQLGMGMAFGSASHAIGTSKAKEFDELTVSISSVAMTLSAILGSSFATLMVWLFNM